DDLILYSFPTRRSSDLYDRLIIDSSEEYIVDLGDSDDDSRLYVSNLEIIEGNDVSTLQAGDADNQWWIGDFDPLADEESNLADEDRKSTRLNSSHVKIS